MQTINVFGREATGDLTHLGAYPFEGSVALLVQNATFQGSMGTMPLMEAFWGNLRPPLTALGFRVFDDGQGPYLVAADPGTREALARDQRLLRLDTAALAGRCA